MYCHCKNCPDTELTPEHLFNCPANLAKLQQISDSPWADLYKENGLHIVDAVRRTLGPIIFFIDDTKPMKQPKWKMGQINV